MAEALLAGLDPMDLRPWEALLALDGQVRIGNRRVAVGRAKCVGELARLFARTASIGRGFRELWPSADGETVLMEVDLWPLQNGAALPLAIIARMIAPQPILRDLRFYLDPSPLRSESASRGHGSGT